MVDKLSPDEKNLKGLLDSYNASQGRLSSNPAQQHKDAEANFNRAKSNFYGLNPSYDSRRSRYQDVAGSIQSLEEKIAYAKRQNEIYRKHHGYSNYKWDGYIAEKQKQRSQLMPEYRAAEKSYESVKERKYELDHAENILKEVNADIATVKTSLPKINAEAQRLAQKVEGLNQRCNSYEHKIAENNKIISMLEKKNQRLFPNKHGKNITELSARHEKLGGRLISWQGSFRESSIRAEMKEIDELIAQYNDNEEKIGERSSENRAYQVRLDETQSTIKSHQDLIAKANAACGQTPTQAAGMVTSDNTQALKTSANVGKKLSPSASEPAMATQQEEPQANENAPRSF